MEAAALAIVGRDEELSLVAAFLEAPDELPAALLLEGEAGIGKSTVWRAGLTFDRVATAVEPVTSEGGAR